MIDHSGDLQGGEITSGRHSYAFGLRLWSEEIDAGHVEWRGRVQSLSTGEVYYFRDWQVLIDAVRAMLPPHSKAP